MAVLLSRACRFRLCRHSAFVVGKPVAACTVVVKENAVEGVGKRLQRPFPHSGLQLAFPHRDAVPAHSGESALLLLVTRLVALYLGLPEPSVCLWDDEVSATVMPMPETAIDEDTCAILAENNVGMTGQARVVQSVTEPTAEQILPHQQLRLGALTPYRSHATMPLLFGHSVWHCFY